MDFMDVVRNRESIRDYDPEKPIERDLLLRVLEAGRLAPSASNRQPWEMLVFESDAGLKRIRSCYDKSWFRDAPVILAVKGSRSHAWSRSDGYNSLETDLTIIMDHLILAAEYYGLATCWIANFDNRQLRSVLELSGDEQVFAMTPLGYPRDGFEKRGRKVRKSLDEVVSFL
jgi:nitroreductase